MSIVIQQNLKVLFKCKEDVLYVQTNVNDFHLWFIHLHEN